jgi:hypothetical protein
MGTRHLVAFAVVFEGEFTETKPAHIIVLIVLFYTILVYFQVSLEVPYIGALIITMRTRMHVLIVMME